MHKWIDTVVAALNLQGIEVTDSLMKEILAVARDAAHNVERPAAPLSTYLMGIAVAQGSDPAEVARIVGDLAQAWTQESGD